MQETTNRGMPRGMYVAMIVIYSLLLVAALIRLLTAPEENHSLRAAANWTIVLGAPVAVLGTILIRRGRTK